jgi:transposase
MSINKGKKGAKADAAKAKEVPVEKLREIVARTSTGPLDEEERTLLASAVDTLGFLTTAIEDKSLTLAKLRSYLFGSATESSKNILGGSGDGGGDHGSVGGGKPKDGEPKPKGHGRRGAEQYTGANRCNVLHANLAEKDACPACGRGKVYALANGRTLVRVTGMAPISATVYELAQLRCNACGTIFTADIPAGVGPAKYDEGAVAMIGLLKYGAGLPFNRIQELQRGLGIPLPASTQWELVSEHSQALLPAYQELVRQAAQGDVLHTDDTTMKILEFVGERRRKAIEAGDIDPDQRVGLFTSGIVSVGGIQTGDETEARPPEIVLFFTGHDHAGENLEEVLKKRAPTLAPPIHMCDALSSNTAGEFEALLARCVAHGRRAFVELFQNFPDECRRVLEDLRTVYRVDGEARVAGLDAQARLALHQEQSKPVMKALHDWMKAQFAERRVEPNSSLGKAIAYMLRHWEGLTLFLREPGAPLDNNTCERALKKAVLNRKNAYFYRTQYGAEVGDLYMSLIHTCERRGTSPFEYLRTLLANAAAVAAAPADWMPWNYAATAAQLKEDAAARGA